jgi:hypothetical protein
MSIGRPFVKGQAKLPGSGRIKGSRNRISEAFLKDLALEWERSGPDALKVMAKEDPGGFVKVTAALLPKEFEITDSRLAELSDEEIDGLISQLRGKIRTAIEDVRSGEGTQTHH